MEDAEYEPRERDRSTGSVILAKDFAGDCESYTAFSEQGELVKGALKPRNSAAFQRLIQKLRREEGDLFKEEQPELSVVDLLDKYQ